jgi:hypothetical protein
MEMTSEKATLMRIWGKPSQIQIMMDKKYPKILECYKYFRSMITNDARRACGIKSRIVLAKTAFNKKMYFFQLKIGITFKTETSKALILTYR